MAAAIQATDPSLERSAHVLTTTGGLLLAKRWRLGPDGPTKTDYDQAKTFTSRENPIGSIYGLSKLLYMLEQDPHSCIIRGCRQEWCADVPTIRRLLIDRPEEDDGRATLEDCPRRWLHLDIDGVPIQSGLSIVDDPRTVIEAVIREVLPADLRGVTMGWQLSSSAGMPGAEGVVKAHLWWWLSRPLGHDELVKWVRHHGLESTVDVAVFRPAQPNYTARPIFDGIEDPLPQRSGMLRYDRDVARLTVPAATTSLPLRLAADSSNGPDDSTLAEVASIFYESSPAEGTGRNDAHLSLANLAADGDMDEERGAVWVASCLPPRDVPRPREALDAMRDALRRKTSGEERRWGWPKLAELFGQAAVVQVRALLGISVPIPSDNDAPGWAEEEVLMAPSAPATLVPPEPEEGDPGPAAQVEAGDPAGLGADNWRDRLLRGKPGKGGTPGPLLASLANAIIILRHHKEWAGVLGYDERALEVTLVRPPPWGGPVPRPVAEADFGRLVVWFADSDRVAFGEASMSPAFATVAADHPFDPVRNYFDGLTWDGKPRLDTWLERYAGANSSPYTRKVGRAWLVSAVARTYQPGCKADSMLVLEGPQGVGKSRLLAAIARGPGERYYSDLSIDPTAKDSVLALHGPLIVEWGELAGLSRRETESTKAFLTRAVDRLRPPYGRITSDYLRRGIIAASTNDNDYLSDVTGNRRFWPIRCGTIDVEGATLDRGQIWAEAVVSYLGGETWWLDAKVETLAAQEQDERVPLDPWAQKLEGELRGYDTFITTDHIVTMLLDLDVRQCKPHDLRRLARCMRSIGWKPVRKQLDGKKKRGFGPHADSAGGPGNREKTWNPQ